MGLQHRSLCVALTTFYKSAIPLGDAKEKDRI